MRLLPPAIAIASLLALALAPTSEARACGGFFCDNVDPVVQTAERILFRVNDDATTTVVVEIQYEGPPSNFGWVLPVAPGLTTEMITTAPAGLFDALEENTAPVFEAPQESGAVGYADYAGGGCGGWRGGGDDFEAPPPPDISGVEVVGAAVVGPYAIEIISAEEADNLSNWLLVNGYQIPATAIPAIDHYLDLGMNFIGVKLQADVPAGPIDALAFTVPGTTPSIPLVLTAIAAAEEMEVIAYVAAPGRHVPGNWVDLDFNYETVHFTGEGETDYREVLPLALDDAGGRAWNTEFAGRIGESFETADTVIVEVLERGDYLTRFHTFISPWEMTEDPWWTPSTAAGDVDNHHVLYGEFDRTGAPARPLAGALVLLPGLLLLRRRRRMVG